MWVLLFYHHHSSEAMISVYVWTFIAQKIVCKRHGLTSNAANLAEHQLWISFRIGWTVQLSSRNILVKVLNAHCPISYWKIKTHASITWYISTVSIFYSIFWCMSRIFNRITGLLTVRGVTRCGSVSVNPSNRRESGHRWPVRRHIFWVIYLTLCHCNYF